MESITEQDTASDVVSSDALATAASSNDMNHPDNNQDHDDDTDIWGSGAGYTPLADWMTSGSKAMFSPGPCAGLDDDEDDSGEHTGGLVTHAGAFFADMSAFAAFHSAASRESDEEDEQDENPKQKSERSNFQELSGVDEDFRAIADQALLALEEEYRLTLQFEESRKISTTSKTEAKPQDEERLNLNLDFTFPNPPSGDFASFVADFDSVNEPKQSAAVDAKKIPDIDADAVRRAVNSINLRDPTLQTKMARWENAHKEAMATAPRVHPIIPSKPLLAFRKKTPKAIEYTSVLSRSATICDALRRLDLLRSQEYLVIHVIGCDVVECESVERIQAVFGPAARWIGAAAEAPRHMRFHLIGPNLELSSTLTDDSTMSVNLFSTRSNKEDGSQSTLQASRFRSSSAIATCHTGMYDEELCNKIFAASEVNSGQISFARPDLIVAFNAGVWGYTDWHATFRYLLSKNACIPTIVTAYTLEEAEDDYDTISGYVAEALPITAPQSNEDHEAEPKHQPCNQQEGRFVGSSNSNASVLARCIWEADPNAFGSRQERYTATAVPGRTYRENAAWQAWKL